MRHQVIAVAVLCVPLALPLGDLAAEPVDQDTVIVGETSEQLCDRLASDPFAGYGPEEWSNPFRTVDFYRAAPACTAAMEAHPAEVRFRLGAAMAYIAGGKKEEAKKLLDPLVARGNSSAMLTLAFISPEPQSAALMRKAGEAGNANGMMLYGMALMTGKGVPKDALAGVRTIRRAAEAGSTRAMLLLGNFYNQGAYGVGLNPDEGRKLIDKAAHLGDPAAKAILASLSEKGSTNGAPQ